jgi:hypothetical protein
MDRRENLKFCITKTRTYEGTGDGPQFHFHYTELTPWSTVLTVLLEKPTVPQLHIYTYNRTRRFITGFK